MSLRSSLVGFLVSTPAKRLLLVEPRFVVVGTGRSGTGYISKVMTAAGIKTGHEAWWNPYGRPGRTRLLGDASWCAVFNLEGYEGHVFHQIRDPLKVVSSLATTELDPAWRNRDNHLYYAWRQRNINLTGNPTIDAMAVVVHWFRESERRSEWAYRVEDINEVTIMEIARRVGLEVKKTRVQEALRAVPTNTNQHQHTDIAWDDLPKNELKAELLAIAAKYGYS
jgi:hypothetical protein